MTAWFEYEELTRWLASLKVLEPGDLQIERIGVGQSNITCRVTDRAGNRVVVRRPPLGHLAESAHDVEREHTVMRALAGSSIPVPRVLGLARAGEVAETKVLALEHVDGLVVDGVPAAEALEPAQRRGIAESMVDTLAAIHAVDLRTAGLERFASHEPLAARQLRRWKRQWAALDARSAVLDDLAARLERNLPRHDNLGLVHGDFHLMNLIFEPGSARVNAVLDWELSTLGDPVADLGSLLAYWVEVGDPVEVGFEGTRLPGFPDRAQLVERYVARSGHEPVGLEFWHVLALWKIAIIATGVLERVRADSRNRAPSVGFDEQKVHDIATLAEAAANDHGW